MVAVAASGIFKQVRYANESTYNVPVAGGGTSYQLRRVSSQLNPDIATFRSNEIQPDRQVHTFRHGTQQVRGTLRGELSPLTFKDFLAALQGGVWTAGASSSVTGLTYAAPVHGTSRGTITRSSGSWITDGFKLYDVISLTGSTISANNARYMRITGESATVLTIGDIGIAGATSNEDLAAGTDGGSVTVAVVGQKVTSPDPSDTGSNNAGVIADPSMDIEHYYSDINYYELYTGVKPTVARLGLTPNAISTIDFDWMGSSFQNGSGGGAYFTAPTAVTTSNSITGTSGVVRLGGVDVALITNLQMTINGGHTVDPVIGSVHIPFVFPGILDINGNMTLLLKDGTIFGDVINETPVDLEFWLTTGTAINSDFMNIHFHNVKLNSNTKDDGPKAIIQNVNFQSIKEQSGGAATIYDNSTMVVQDSLASGTP